jgi:hypothetical protein
MVTCLWGGALEYVRSGASKGTNCGGNSGGISSDTVDIGSIFNISPVSDGSNKRFAHYHQH